jgi:hypothetical protein
MDHNVGFTTGIYKPTTWITPVTDFPAPAPAGAYIEPGWTPGGPTLKSTFQGTSPNGTWSLYLRYVSTRTAPTPAVNGTIAAGWGIQFFSPTAATVSVSGRVLSSMGTPLRNARVTLDNGTGRPLQVITNAFGYYRFDTVQAGGTYLVNAALRGYVFTPRVIAVNDALTDVNMTALP